MMATLLKAQEDGFPSALDRRPNLSVVEGWYYDCFSELSQDRSYSMSGPLPLTTGQIETYRRVFEIPDRDEFHHWMRIIDTAWLAEANAKSEKSSKPSGGKP